jgi:hypothetical protein
MFPDDPGEEEVRATVHGWKLTLPSAQDDTTIEDESRAAPAENERVDPKEAYLAISLQPSSRLSSISSRTPKKTLVLDLNGTLVYRTKGRAKTSSEAQQPVHIHPVYGPSPRSSTVRATWSRPYLPSFIRYLNHPKTKEWLDAVVWSSARPESVDEMLSKAGFTRQGDGWEELRGVWARDKMGLSFEAYRTPFFRGVF